MNEKPLHNEPGYENNQKPQDISNYNEIIRHETIRIAVIEMTNNSDMANALPETLRSMVTDLYTSFLDGYLLTCEQKLKLDGTKMIDPFREPRGVFCYKKLMEVLQKDVEKEVEG